MYNNSVSVMVALNKCPSRGMNKTDSMRSINLNLVKSQSDDGIAFLNLFMSNFKAEQRSTDISIGVYFSVVSLSQMSLIIKAGSCESGFVFVTFNFPVLILIGFLEFKQTAWYTSEQNNSRSQCRKHGKQ